MRFKERQVIAKRALRNNCEIAIGTVAGAVVRVLVAGDTPGGSVADQ